MDANEVKIVHGVAFAVLVPLCGIIFVLFFTVVLHIIFLFHMVLSTALSKRFYGSKEAVDEIPSISSNRGRRLNLLEIIVQLFWFNALTLTGHCFISATIPVEFLPNLKAYKKRKYKWSRSTPFFFKYLLNNPSETAADLAETFTRRVLTNLGFHHLSNPNPNYQDGYGSSAYYFEQTLSKSCFARQLIETYNSIDWDNAGVPPPPTQFTGLERMIMRTNFMAPEEDDEWVIPFNNWFNWYTKTIHQRIFPSQDYQVFEDTVKFLFFSFLHDTAAPFIGWFALFGVTTL